MKTSLLPPLRASLLLLGVTAGPLSVGHAAVGRAENGKAPMNQPLDAVPAPAPPFAVTAQAKAPEIKSGEPIELKIEITNTSDHQADLNFSSGQSFDFSATEPNSKAIVWSWGRNKRFMQMIRTVSLEPGKSLSFDASWNNAAPGTYSVSGLITANGGLSAPAFTIVVK